MSTYSPFVAALHVFIGGGAGAVLRWQLGRAMTGWLGAPIVTAFPFATLAANAAGSLLMGRSSRSMSIRFPAIRVSTAR